MRDPYARPDDILPMDTRKQLRDVCDCLEEPDLARLTYELCFQGEAHKLDELLRKDPAYLLNTVFGRYKILHRHEEGVVGGGQAT